MYTAEDRKKTALNKVPPRMTDKYTLRVKEASPKPSNAGNPMVTLKCEIVKPTTITVDGQQYALDQLPVNYYFPLKGDSDDKTERMRADYFEFREKMGLNPDFEPDNPDVSDLDGLVFEAILSSSDDIVQRQGPNGYEKVIDEATGKPISRGFKINANKGVDILGRSTFVPQNPY